MRDHVDIISQTAALIAMLVGIYMAANPWYFPF